MKKKIVSSLVLSLLIAQSVSAITISAVGDIMLGTDYPSGGKSTVDFFAAVRPYMKENDINFGNYEGTLYDGPVQPDGKKPGKNRYLFRTHPGMVGHLQKAGYDVMSLSNNHARDFGSKGLQSTKQTLKNAGISYSSKDGEVATFKIGGTSIAIIATDYFSGKRSITNPAATYAEISQLKRDYDVVMVSVHAGGEGAAADRVSDRNEIYLGENRGNSVRFARSAIDAGADFIVMHGPHIPRGMEVYRDRLIAYSLGNFMTGQGISIAGTTGIAPLLEVELDNQGRFVQGKITSFVQDRSKGLVLDSKKRALSIMANLSAKDFPQSMPSFDGSGMITPGRSQKSRLP